MNSIMVDVMRLHPGRIPIFIPSDGSSPRVGADLDQKELAAIGMFVVLWSYLEYAIYEKSIELCNGQSPPDKVYARPFKDRLGELHRLAEAANKTDLLSLVGKIANIEGKRHKICHGLWDWDASDSDSLLVESNRRPFFFQASTDFGDLIDLSLQVGKLIYQLKYGDEDPISVVAKLSEDGFLSREFLRSVRSDDPKDYPSQTPKKRRKRGRAL